MELMERHSRFFLRDSRAHRPRELRQRERSYVPAQPLYVSALPFCDTGPSNCLTAPSNCVTPLADCETRFPGGCVSPGELRHRPRELRQENAEMRHRPLGARYAIPMGRCAIRGGGEAIRRGGSAELEGRDGGAMLCVARGARRLSVRLPRAAETEGRMAGSGGGITHQIPARAERDRGIALAGSPYLQSQRRRSPALSAPAEPGTESRDCSTRSVVSQGTAQGGRASRPPRRPRRGGRRSGSGSCRGGRWRAACRRRRWRDRGRGGRAGCRPGECRRVRRPRC